MNMNFKLLFLIAAFCTLANQIACVNPFPKSQLLSSPLAQKYYEKYDKIHVDTLNCIKNEFNIADADVEWCWCMNQVADLIKNHMLFASYMLDRSSISADDHLLVKEAKEILIQCGINPKNVEITIDNDPKRTVEATAQLKQLNGSEYSIQNELIINPDWLGKLLPHEREATFRHEIIHLAFFDSIERYCIFELLKRNGHTQETIEKNPAIINYNHQIETRADILSVIDKPLLAKAFQDYFEKEAEFTKSFPVDYWNTAAHPSNETRAQNFAQLLTEINQPQFA